MVGSISRTGAGGFAAWNRVGIVYHAREPGVRDAQEEHATVMSWRDGVPGEVALVLIIRRVFPPPPVPVQKLYTTLVRDARASVIVALVQERGFAVSVVRNIFARALSMRGGIKFEIASSIGDVADAIAQPYGDGASGTQLFTVIRELRETVDNGDAAP